jgi:hypothetical protein
VNPIYLLEGRKVLTLPLFEIRAATVDRTITSFFFPCLSLLAPLGCRRRGGRWAGAYDGGSSLAVGGGRGGGLWLGFQGIRAGLQ